MKYPSERKRIVFKETDFADGVIRNPIEGYNLKDVMIHGEINAGGFIELNEEKKIKLPGQNKKEKQMSKKSKGGRGAALKTPMRCSSELRELLGEKKLARGESIKRFWKYVKKHKLQDKEDGRIIRSDKDKKLAAVVGKKPIKMTQVAGKLFAHLSED
jgi:chromatin remodeling complex protein RSC6